MNEEYKVTINNGHRKGEKGKIIGIITGQYENIIVVELDRRQTILYVRKSFIS